MSYNVFSMTNNSLLEINPLMEDKSGGDRRYTVMLPVYSSQSVQLRLWAVTPYFTLFFYHCTLLKSLLECLRAHSWLVLWLTPHIDYKQAEVFVLQM